MTSQMTRSLKSYLSMELKATELKAKCLQLLDEVNRTGEVVTITKRGKVVVELRALTARSEPTQAPARQLARSKFLATSWSQSTLSGKR